MILRWQTLSEKDSLGFQLYRANGRQTGTQLPQDARAMFNALIPAVGTSGASYSAFDDSASASAIYSYWLVDVNVDGVQTVHGPAVAQSAYIINLPMITAGD